jgi:hypothetical protein
VWRSGERYEYSVSDVLALDDIAIAAWGGSAYSMQAPRAQTHPRDSKVDIATFGWYDLPVFARDEIWKKLNSMEFSEIARVEDLILLRFSRNGRARFQRAHDRANAWIGELPASSNDIIRCEFLGSAGAYFHVLNSNAEIIRWLAEMRKEARESPTVVNPEHVEAAWLEVCTAWYNVEVMLKRWERAPNVPERLRPPKYDAQGLPRLRVSVLHSASTGGERLRLQIK